MLLKQQLCIYMLFGFLNENGFGLANNYYVSEVNGVKGVLEAGLGNTR